MSARLTSSSCARDRRRAPFRARVCEQVERLGRLGSLFLETSSLKRDAGPPMRALASRYGESVWLAAWLAGRPVCIAACEGRRSGSSSPVGMSLPAHCTALGKVLLAWRPREEVWELLVRDGLERMSDHTTVTLERLRELDVGTRGDDARRRYDRTARSSRPSSSAGSRENREAPSARRTSTTSATAEAVLFGSFACTTGPSDFP